VGGVSGGLAAVTTTPFDVIKTRMMTAEPGEGRRVQGLVGVGGFKRLIDLSKRVSGCRGSHVRLYLYSRLRDGKYSFRWIILRSRNSRPCSSSAQRSPNVFCAS
jgi:hypothetical protein